MLPYDINNLHLGFIRHLPHFFKYRLHILRVVLDLEFGFGNLHINRDIDLCIFKIKVRLK